jgi:hypothetical protein
MLRGTTVGGFVLGAILPVFIAGCFYESTSSSNGGGPGGTSTTSPGGNDATNNATPMLVDVDPDRTLNANPGDGVGVFTEYASGGHWHVWWSCDTNTTGQSCTFDVKVTVPVGTAISNVSGDGLSTSDKLYTPSSTLVEAVTTTTTSTSGIWFDTPAGTVITLTASVGGLTDGAFLFFVQDGKINGGYTGKLSDPLMLEGASP